MKENYFRCVAWLNSELSYSLRKRTFWTWQNCLIFARKFKKSCQDQPQTTGLCVYSHVSYLFFVSNIVFPVTDILLATLKSTSVLYAFEESVDCALLSSFCNASNLHISPFRYVLSTMGVSKESISKFLIGNRFHVKLRILNPEKCKQSLRVKSWKAEVTAEKKTNSRLQSKTRNTSSEIKGA